MYNLAIIPARGGSKRIPRKNIRDFLGKPVIAYSIESALNSGLFDEVMVSTEDEEIANIALKYGAVVPFMRSRGNANDYATTMDVVLEVLNCYFEIKKCKFNYACCIYPAAPLIRISHLKQGFKDLKEKNYVSVYPVVAFGYPVWRGLTTAEDGMIKMIWPEFLTSRSQDLQKVYHDAGQWYWFNTDHLESWNELDNSGCIILSEEEVQDIDTMADWKLAEMKYKILHEKAV